MDFNKNNNKKILIPVLAVALLVVATLGATYAFFNYTRTGNRNTVTTGRINFNADYEAFNLTNAFPITSEEAGNASNPNVKTMQIQVVGDTDYSEGIEYLVTATDVNMTVGEQNKLLPITIEVGTSNNTENNPETTLGEIETGDYYSLRNNYKSLGSSKYKVVYDGSLDEGDRILVGYIAPNQTPGTIEGIDGIITLKAYIDASKVVISDTYPEGEVEVNNQTYYNGTLASFGQGKTVFTTEEWNSIQEEGKELSFKIKVEANPGIWVSNPGSAPMTINNEHASDVMVPGTTRNVEITPNGDGEITCTSSNTNVATCSIEDSINPTGISASGVDAVIEYNDIATSNIKVQKLDTNVGTKYVVINAVGMGTATITITQTAGREYATPSILTYDVEVGKLTTTMSLSENSGNIILEGSKKIIITTNGDGELSCNSSDITKATCSIEGTELTINGVGAGNAIITVSQGEGTLHLAPTNVEYNVTVSKKNATISLSENSGNVVYGESKEITVTTDGDGVLNCNSSDPTKATCSITNNIFTINGTGAGEAIITVSTEETSNYNAASTTYALTIDKAEGYVNLSATSGSYTYLNDSGISFTITESHGGTLSTDKCTLNGTKVTCSGTELDAGTYTITVTSAATENYTEATATYELTVNKCVVTFNARGRNISEGKAEIITVTASTNFKGTAIAQISGTTYSAEIIQGTGKIFIEGLTRGKYIAKVTVTAVPFDSDSNYIIDDDYNVTFSVAKPKENVS